MTLWSQRLARMDSAPAALGFPGKAQLPPGVLGSAPPPRSPVPGYPGLGRERHRASDSPPRGAEPGGCESNRCNPKAVVIIFKCLLSCYPSPPLSFFLHPDRTTDKRVKSSLGPPAPREGSCNVVSRPSEDIYKFPPSLRIYL